MKLSELIENCNYDNEVTGITSDTRFLKSGYLFIPLKGKNFNGEEFITEAINKKAAGIVLEKEHKNLGIPCIACDNSFEMLKKLLIKFYGSPFNNLCLIGVTGTDGKTTTSTIISYLLSTKFSTGYIGTNGIHLKNEFFPNLFTTPLLSENYRLIKAAEHMNINYLAMEVSSQGIVAKRVDTLLFDYVIFTNLSHEHLDTHHTLDEYFQAKFKLFSMTKKKNKKIVNKDDEYSKYFESLDDVIYYSIYEVSDYQAKNIRYINNSTYFDLYTKNTVIKNLHINRMEEYNLYNILPGIIISLLEGISVDELYTRLNTLPLIPGRLEKITSEMPFDIYVDFAHTPNALRAVLTSLKKNTKNRVIIVCGAAGKKDKSKRPIMGKVACEFADFVVFTSEDPRFENPSDIINQMVSEITSTNYICIEERTSAINYAINMATAGDSIIVTGKGRENYFEKDGIIYNYSDYEYIKKAIQKMNV